jgi:hypothetical protein
VDNYFNYFTEVEEHFQRRRGSVLLLSTLDWALIETWKDAGIPLEAALRGIDATFESYDRKPSRAKTRKVNSLAFCTQEVLAAAAEMKEAATGTSPEQRQGSSALPAAEIAVYLRKNAEILRAARATASLRVLLDETAGALEGMSAAIESSGAADCEDIERRLTVLEERLFAALHAAASADELLEVRTQADRDMAPYRSKMTGPQIEQLHRQYVNKRLLERAKLPRLSLFYM